MNNFHVLFLLMLLPFSYSAQSKKQQIVTLTNRIDSLNQVINQKEDNIETKNKTIKDLNKTITDLNIKISNCNLTNDVKQQKIDFLEAKIKNLNDSIFKLVQLSPKNFKFPYEYGKKIVFGDAYYSTFYFDSKKEFQVITDSIIVHFNNNENFHFYFFTPITEELNTQCPGEFGYIVLNNKAEKVFEIFENSGNFENSYSDYLEFDLKTKKRRLLGLLSSGCGSGGTKTYYELDVINDELIQKPKITVSTGGYETTYFLPEEEQYVELIRINPEAHWSGDTRYKLNFYDLNNDKKIATKETKYTYQHFGEIETSLLNSIKKSEPNVFKF